MQLWEYLANVTGGVKAKVVDSFTSKAIVLAAGTLNQSIIAAPGAGKAIYVYALSVHGATGAGTLTLQDEDDTALSGAIALDAGYNYELTPAANMAMPWIKVATNKALEGDTAGLCTVGGVITYAVVTV